MRPEIEIVSPYSPSRPGLFDDLTDNPDAKYILIQRINEQARTRGPGEQLHTDIGRANFGLKICDKGNEAEINLDLTETTGEKRERRLLAHIKTPTDLVDQIKTTAIDFARHNGFRPQENWLEGIDNIAKYHDQLFLGFGTALPQLYFIKYIEALITPLNYFLKTSAKKNVTLFYNAGLNKWFYEVQNTLYLQNGDDPKNPRKLSDVICIFEVTQSGFKLDSLTYSNPIIEDIIKYNTPLSALKFLLLLLEDFDLDFQYKATIQLLELQKFPFSDWYAFFIQRLKKNSPNHTKGACKFLDKKKPLCAKDAYTLAVLELEESQDIRTAFHQAIYQAYCLLPGANTGILFKEILPPELQKSLNEPFALAAQDRQKFLIYTTPETREALELLKRKATETEGNYNSRSLTGSPLPRYSFLAGRMQEKTYTSEKNILFEKFYETKKQQIADVLPHLTDKDAIILLDKLFFIRDTLNIQDNKHSIDWPVISNDSEKELAQMSEALEKLKMDALCVLRNAIETKTALTPGFYSKHSERLKEAQHITASYPQLKTM